MVGTNVQINNQKKFVKFFFFVVFSFSSLNNIKSLHLECLNKVYVELKFGKGLILINNDKVLNINILTKMNLLQYLL